MNPRLSAALGSLLALTLTGCLNLPENLARNAKVAALRHHAVPLDRLPSVTTVHAELSPGANLTLYERLFFKTTIAPDPERSKAGINFLTMRVEYRTPQLAPGTPAELDSTLLETLSRRGFASVSRNISRHLDPAALSGQRPRGNLLGAASKRALLLLVTVHEPRIIPRIYKWRTFVWTMHYEKQIGSDVSGLVTAQILDAESGESLWSGSAAVQALFAHQPSPDEIATRLVGFILDRLPTVSPAVATIPGLTPSPRLLP